MLKLWPLKLRKFFSGLYCISHVGGQLLFSNPIAIKYIHWGLTQLELTCGPGAMLSRFTVKLANHYAPNWFNCRIVGLFWAKSGKHYSKKRAKLMQLWKERTVIVLGFYLIRGKLQLLQTSVNILYDIYSLRKPKGGFPFFAETTRSELASTR